MLRYWDWPYWDIQSLAFLSHTQIGSASYANVKTYYNTFSNGLNSYDNGSYTTQRTTRSFQSYYDDQAYGISLEAGTDLIPLNALKGAFHFRRDMHTEWQTLFAPIAYTEPKQSTNENTYSLALEDTVHVTATVDLVGGISYDWRHLDQAKDWDGTSLRINNYELANSDAIDWQGAAIWHFSGTGQAHASVSARTRFPTIFERYSTRFGGATSNPGLRSERGLNTEIGATDQVFGNVRLEGAVFYSHVDDLIEAVPILYRGTTVTQSQNIGSGNYYGFEIGMTTRPLPRLELGGNYTLIQREIDNPANPLFHLTDVPMNKIFAYATYDVLNNLTVTPSFDLASKRWALTNGGTYYFQTGAYVLANVQVDYKATRNVELAGGVRNLFDLNYSLTDSFLETGRTFFLKTRVTF
jgi:iron complex outermembrane recepter protein